LSFPTVAARRGHLDFHSSGTTLFLSATRDTSMCGRSFGGPRVHVFSVREGKIARFQGYDDTAAAERAFLPDQPGQRTTSAAPLRH